MKFYAISFLLGKKMRVWTVEKWAKKKTGGDGKMEKFLMMGGKEGEMWLRTAELFAEGNWLEF